MSSLQTCLCSGRGGEVLALPTCNSMGREEKHLIKASETPKKDAGNRTSQEALLQETNRLRPFGLLTPGSKEWYGAPETSKNGLVFYTFVLSARHAGKARAKPSQKV